MSNFDKVGTFMKTFGQEVKTKPSFSSDKINKLRIDLIKEELEELTEAMQKKRFIRGCRCFDRYTLCNIWSRPCIWY